MTNGHYEPWPIKDIKTKLVTKDELRALVGPDNATGVVRAGCSAEDWRLFDKHTRDQGQPTKPNRASRRKTARLKQKAITKKRRRDAT